MTSDLPNMKRQVSFVGLFFVLVLVVHFTQGQQLTVQTEAGKQVVLTRGDIEGLDSHPDNCRTILRSRDLRRGHAQKRIREGWSEFRRIAER